jgi:hypothetical protein
MLFRHDSLPTARPPWRRVVRNRLSL